MKILLTYATNSGSTEIVAKLIAEILTQKDFEVTVKQAKDIVGNEISNYDLFIIGSPSWDELEIEGQPLPEIIDLLKRLDKTQLTNKPLAIFGLGDKSYTNFCGAVDVLENFFKSVNAKLIVESLRIDNYYCNPQAPAQVQSWTEKLAILCAGEKI